MLIHAFVALAPKVTPCTYENSNKFLKSVKESFSKPNLNDVELNNK